METPILILSIGAGVLGALLLVLGIQAFLVLRDVRKTLTRVNTLVDVVEHTTLKILLPISSLGGFAQGMKSGLKVFETFVEYLRRHDSKSK
jgi:hypothetical protein